MDTEQILLIVALVVLALLVVGLLAWAARKKKKEQQRREDAERAQRLRAEADQRANVIPEARLEAEQAELEAEQVRLEAERQQLEADRARARADEAKTGLAHEEAAYEDRVREADRVDPRDRPDHPEQGGTHRA